MRPTGVVRFTNKIIFYFNFIYVTFTIDLPGIRIIVNPAQNILAIIYLLRTFVKL